MFRKILLSFIIILLLVQNSLAVVNTFATTNDAYCISKSYDGTDFLTVGRYTGTQNSSVESWAINGAGVFTTSVTRATELTATTDNLFCGVEDYTQTAVANLKRTVFLIKNGAGTGVYLAYSDNTTNDIGLGQYTAANTGGYVLLATLPNANPNSHITINSVGDIFVWDDTSDIIYVYDKSNLYASSVFHTVTSADLGDVALPQINDISIDKDDNVFVLVSGQTGTYESVLIYDSSGTEIGSVLNISRGMANVKSNGFIVPDHTDPLNNFAFAWYNGTNSYIYHYSSGVYNLTGTETGNIILDGTYISGNIWYSTDANTVVSLATAYTGFSPTGVAGTPENTYIIKNINSLRASYYNNSNFQIYYKLNVETNAIRELDSVASRALYGYGVANNYIWKVSLIDTNGIDINNFYTDHCEDNLLLTECTLSGNLEYKPPKTNWTEGTYHAELWEYNQQNFNYALIATSETWSVGNNSSTPIGQPNEPITSGTGENTLTQIDGWVGLLGLGVNGISKFLFAMLLILSVTFFGFIGTKGNSMGGAIAGALPFTFFVFIEFIPVWTIIIVVMVVAIKTGWFR